MVATDSTNVLIGSLCSRTQLVGSRFTSVRTDGQGDLSRCCAVPRNYIKMPYVEIMCKSVCVWGGGDVSSDFLKIL